MREEIKNDNIYPVGTKIRARNSPSVNLVIVSYQQRIYYCAEPGKPGKELVYFERELIPPAASKPLVALTRLKEELSLISRTQLRDPGLHLAAPEEAKPF